jgi:uncharacterized protein
MKPLAIDAFDFGRLKEQREGEIPVAELSRLVQECVDSSGVLHWVLTGGTHASGHPELNLQVTGAVQLVCQRCLQPFSFGIDAESVLVLAHDEQQADEIEASLEDDAIDVIVGSKAMNVVDLIEDEALLAIPQAPKHAACAADNAAGGAENIVVKLSPFAALKNLKH